MAIVAIPGTAFSAADPMSNEAIIESATSAAPTVIGESAKVTQVTEDGQIRDVREGTNNVTCLADNPGSPGNVSVCFDENGIQWASAWMGKTEPPADKIGFLYMLQEGSDASNTESYAPEPTIEKSGSTWAPMS